MFDARVFGFPAESLRDVPAGDYSVQAVLHLYETFQVAHGHTLKLPMDRGEGQHWNRAPGNLFSTPRRVHFDPAGAAREPLEIVLDQVIPPIEPPEDTKYVRHVRMRSELLSKFWGRPVELGAHVLVPEGFDGALLERRPREREPHLAAQVQHDVPAEDPRAHRGERAGGRGPLELAVLRRRHEP